MFFTIQFPIVDSRKFLTEDTGLLKIPCWPTPVTDQDFVRYFGTIRQRKRGGISGWIGESEVCEARRALRIQNQPKVQIDHSAVNLNFDIAFRRFYFDGYAIGKFEIGINVHTKNRSWLEISQDGLSEIITYILEYPVRIPQPNVKNADTICPLNKAGRNIAELYRLASTVSSFNKPVQNWWVSAGKPVILLENNNFNSISFPYWGKTIPLTDFSPETSMSYYHIPYEGINIPLWVLQIDDITKMREMRVSLLRLHAERECLRKILANIHSEKISVVRGTQASENLQNFLNEAIRRIITFEKKPNLNFFSNSDFAMYAAQYVNPGADEAILRSLKDIRVNVLHKVKDYLRSPQVIQEITMGDIYINEGDAGIFGPDGKVEDMQVIQITGKIGDTVDWNKLAEELSALKAAMKKEAETPEQLQSVVAVAEAEKAAKQGEKNKTIAFLKSAGKWAFDTATKIGIGVATAVIKTELGY